MLEKVFSSLIFHLKPDALLTLHCFSVWKPLVCLASTVSLFSKGVFICFSFKKYADTNSTSGLLVVLSIYKKRSWEGDVSWRTSLRRLRKGRSDFYFRPMCKILKIKINRFSLSLYNNIVLTGIPRRFCSKQKCGYLELLLESLLNKLL